MDSSTLNMYNLQLQQQIRQEGQYSQQHQSSFCDTTAETHDMIWENGNHFNQQQHKKEHSVKNVTTPYILSPPIDHDYVHRHHPYHPPFQNVYIDHKSDNHHGFYHEEQIQMKREDSSSLFIDSSSINRQSMVTTTNMYAREDNISQSSSNNTVPSSSSVSVKRKGTRKQQQQQTNTNETNRKKSNNAPTIVTGNREGVMVEKRRYRRESHNAVERRRRNNINDNIKSLGQLLPDNMKEGKLNKGSILKGSVVYIHMLNEQLAQYKERLESLQYEAASLSAATSSV